MLGLMVSAASFGKENSDNSDKKVIATSISVPRVGSVQLAIGKNEGTASIKLKDQDGNLLYISNYDLQKSNLLPFNVSGLEAGKYKFEISVGKQLITRSFAINYIPSSTKIHISK